METKKRYLFEIPLSIQTGFKAACAKNGKTMTSVVVNFMENFARAHGTDIPVELAEAVEETDEMLGG